MLKIYFKIIARRLKKDRVNTLINVFGLTLGLGVATLIGMYVLTEWQTDRSLPHPDRTYRVVRVSDINNNPYDIGVTSAPYAPALEQDYPAFIESSVRVVDGQSLVQVGEQRYQENDYYYVDAAFFEFFGFKLAHGNPETALSQPQSIVLTLEKARLYFGSAEAAMGQSLRIDNDYDAVVRGILEESNSATHFAFDILESIRTIEGTGGWDDWWNNFACTYVRLHPDVAADQLEAQLPAFMDKYFASDFERTGRRMDLRLQPLRSVYFEADTRYDPVRHGNLPALRIFLAATLLLIVIALFNYVNLTTAKTVERGVEIGIYKALGSDRAHIVTQVLGETFVLTSFSLLIACFSAWYFKGWFEQFFEVALHPALTSLTVVALIIGLVLALTIIAGLYPGLLLSSYQPAHALKGLGRSGGRSLLSIRRVLVVFQFALSIGLLACTLVIQSQLSFLTRNNLGFDKEHVVLIRANNPDIYAQRSSFKERLRQVAGVSHVSVASGYPGGFHDTSAIEIEGKTETVRMRTTFVDFDYASTFGLEVIAGRDFSEMYSTDSTQAVLLNEQAVKELGMSIDEVMNLRVMNPFFDDEQRSVVGVVKDYNFSSLHNSIEPLIISTNFGGHQVAIKAEAERLPEVIEAAQALWNEYASAYPFSYTFLDERLEQAYVNEARQTRIFGLFAGIAIIIASLGMLGLTAFAVSRRMKEIGIRKVLGASLGNVVYMLSRSFLLQVAVAGVIAIPVAYYFLQRWLDGFAYHIEMTIWVFVLAGAIAVLVAGLTVGILAARAALSNPVEALRYE